MDFPHGHVSLRHREFTTSSTGSQQQTRIMRECIYRATIEPVILREPTKCHENRCRYMNIEGSRNSWLWRTFGRPAPSPVTPLPNSQAKFILRGPVHLSALLKAIAPLAPAYFSRGTSAFPTELRDRNGFKSKGNLNQEHGARERRFPSYSVPCTCLTCTFSLDWSSVPCYVIRIGDRVHLYNEPISRLSLPAAEIVSRQWHRDYFNRIVPTEEACLLKCIPVLWRTRMVRWLEWTWFIRRVRTNGAETAKSISRKRVNLNPDTRVQVPLLLSWRDN